MPEFRIAATTTDAQDGLSRLLGDVARFGYGLMSVKLDASPTPSRIEMHVTAENVTSDLMGARLARHPSILRLCATEHRARTQTGQHNA